MNHQVVCLLEYINKEELLTTGQTTSSAPNGAVRWHFHQPPDITTLQLYSSTDLDENSLTGLGPAFVSIIKNMLSNNFPFLMMTNKHIIQSIHSKSFPLSGSQQVFSKNNNNITTFPLLTSLKREAVNIHKCSARQ